MENVHKRFCWTWTVRKGSQFISKGILISQTCFTKSKLCLRKGGSENGVGIIPTLM